MVHCKIEELYTKRYVCLWTLLSFKAGLINAIGFLAAGKFVSHVTGFGTQIGMSFGQGKYAFGLELLFVPACFILGSALVTFILENQYKENLIPNYPLIQGLITLLIGLTAFMSILGYFDESRYLDKPTLQIVFLSLLCLICGLKNGLTTWATHGKIRTTHITGLATDIGLHIPKFFLKNKEYRYPEKRSVNITRIITLISFSLGSFFTAISYPIMGEYVLLLVFLLSCFLFLVSFIHRQKTLNQYSITIKQGEKDEDINQIYATRDIAK